MSNPDAVIDFYRKHLPEATFAEGKASQACPFCPKEAETVGILTLDLDPKSLFFGLWGCSALCTRPGFAVEFARRRDISLAEVPGFDPDREVLYRAPPLPHQHKNNEMHRFIRMLSDAMREPFSHSGIGKRVLDLFQVGYNGRMYTFPYLQDDRNCYAIRCSALASRFEEPLWVGPENFSQPPNNLWNVPAVAHADGGTLFVTVGEKNAFAIAQAGYPVVALPTVSDDESISAERLQFVSRVLIVAANSAEGQDCAKRIALRLGYKVRILRWPADTKKNVAIADLLASDPEAFPARLRAMIDDSEPLSPLSLARREFAAYREALRRQRGRELLGLKTCFPKLNAALDGLRGLNVLGAQPKAGKSTFFMQLATSLALDERVPVIYYDFENGRNKIYNRTLCRLSRLAEKDFTRQDLPAEREEALSSAMQRMRQLMDRFKVVSDRKINPDMMRRQIDFLRLDSGQDELLLVIDSLHKLPFGKLSERRSGIDAWLRSLEQIRDEMDVSFLVVSELSRAAGGAGYDAQAGLASFKESGDIEYTADNALIMATKGSVYDDEIDGPRTVDLWLVASREMSPGKVATYEVQYPYWSFREE